MGIIYIASMTFAIGLTLLPIVEFIAYFIKKETSLNE